jgi:hypothetical protein
MTFWLVWSPGIGLGPRMGLVAPIGGQAAEKSTPSKPVVAVSASRGSNKSMQKSMCIYEDSKI